jgi:hypothetical protein
MIHHVIMFKLKEFPSKDEKLETANVIKNALEALPAKIEQIKSFEIGINILESERAFDIVLVSKFNSLEDLKIYVDHKEHQNVVTLIRKYSEKTVSVDYEK